jgi:hypothetical protein
MDDIVYDLNNHSESDLYRLVSAVCIFSVYCDCFSRQIFLCWSILYTDRHKSKRLVIILFDKDVTKFKVDSIGLRFVG